MQQIQMNGFNIAVEGCFHGNDEEVFGTMRAIEQQKGFKFDLLILCGDVQSFRNLHDMYNMACPAKYLKLGQFYKYYTGELVAPCLVLFVGGNHEASNYLRELYMGGWVAPNIYYLGYSNILRVCKGNASIRIGGISGIFKIYDFNNPKYDAYPFDADTIRNAYHYKQLEVYKFNLYQGNVDIFISHDWPQSVYFHGNTKSLLQQKKHFADDVKHDKLGSPPLKFVLNTLQPSYWFAGHMHCRFEALVKHKGLKTTKFLALDKCLPGRDFLHVFQIREDKTVVYNDFDKGAAPAYLSYDAEWLAITQVTYKLLTIWDQLPRLYVYDHDLKGYRLTNVKKFNEMLEEKLQVFQKYHERDNKIPLNFQIQQDPHSPQDKTARLIPPKQVRMNNQTKEFLEIFGESGQELNGFLYLDPMQERVIKQFQKQSDQQRAELEGGKPHEKEQQRERSQSPELVIRQFQK